MYINIRYVPAYSTRLKYESGTWIVLPANATDPMEVLDPIWTESNWDAIGLRVYQVQDASYDRLVFLGGIAITVLAYLLILTARAIIMKALKQDWPSDLSSIDLRVQKLLNWIAVGRALMRMLARYLDAFSLVALFKQNGNWHAITLSGRICKISGLFFFMFVVLCRVGFTWFSSSWQHAFTDMVMQWESLPWDDQTTSLLPGGVTIQ